MHHPTKLSVILLGAGLGGCTVPLGSFGSHLAASRDDGAALDARLTRCAALGDKATSDPDCQSAWAEARRRVLPVPPEK